jgi:hypothetical protein
MSSWRDAQQLPGKNRPLPFDLMEMLYEDMKWI